MDVILSKHRAMTGRPDNIKQKRAQNGKMQCKLCPVMGGALKECVPRFEGDVQGWVHVSLPANVQEVVSLEAQMSGIGFALQNNHGKMHNNSYRRCSQRCM